MTDTSDRGDVHPRHRAFGGATIVFRVDPNGVEIGRILHGGRDRDAALAEPA